MENLREEIEVDLQDTIEGEFRTYIEITSPDGQIQRYNVHNPSDKLAAFVRYHCVRMNPQTGESIVVDEPVVILRKSSLIRVPKGGEKWYVKTPTDPVHDAKLRSFIFSPDRAIEGSDDIGYVTMYPQRIEQSKNPNPPVPVS